MCYGDPSATEVPPCCETATKKLTFSTTSVLLLLKQSMIHLCHCPCPEQQYLWRQKNPRRVYRPKIAGILFVCNEPEGKYYTVHEDLAKFKDHFPIPVFTLTNQLYKSLTIYTNAQVLDQTI